MRRLQSLLKLRNSAVRVTKRWNILLPGWIEGFLLPIYRFLTWAQQRWVKPLNIYSWQNQSGPAAQRGPSSVALLKFLIHTTVTGKLVTSTKEQQAQAGRATASQPSAEVIYRDPPRRQRFPAARPGAVPCPRSRPFLPARRLPRHSGRPGARQRLPSHRAKRPPHRASRHRSAGDAGPRPPIGGRRRGRWDLKGRAGRAVGRERGSPPHVAPAASGEEGRVLRCRERRVSCAASKGERPGSGRGWVTSSELKTRQVWLCERFLQALLSSPETTGEAVAQKIRAVNVSGCKRPRTELSVAATR